MRTLAFVCLISALVGCKKSSKEESANAPPSAPRPSASEARTAPVNPAKTDLFSTAWTKVAESKSGCDDFDYFPDGGMRNTACHLMTLVTYPELLAAAKRIWKSGPHGTQRLRLDAEDAFGHYDPAFVDFFADNAVVGANSSSVKEATKPVYDRVFSNLAKIYLRAKLHLERQPELLAQEKAYLLAYMRAPRDERPLDRLGRYEPEDAYNLYGPALAFWIRRDVDGTAEKFEAGLRKLIATYEPEAIATIEAMSFGAPEVADDEPEGSGASAAAMRVPEGPVDQMIAEAWRRYEQVPFDEAKGGFEYQPGGMQVQYGYLSSLIPFATFRAKVPSRIFVSGPHEDGLDLSNDKSFGHYDPKFVAWWVDHAIPAERDSALRAATQGAYDKRARVAARSFYAAYLRLRDDADFRATEKKAYEAYLAGTGPTPHLSYWEAMPGDYSAQAIGGTGVAFWLRRDLDGTTALFVRGLEKLLTTYDVEFLRHAQVAGFAKLVAEPQHFTAVDEEAEYEDGP